MLLCKFLHTYILNNYEAPDFKLNIRKKQKNNPKNEKSDRMNRPQHFILKVHNVQLIL